MTCSDPLFSWNEGSTKQSILDFVRGVATAGSSHFVKPEERIAVFDNDGTLWSEQPFYFQVAFVLDRMKAMAPEHPEWKDNPLYAAVLNNDLKTVAAGGEKAILELATITHAGMTTDEFTKIVADWIASAKHPKFNRLYTDIIYQPMLELLAYLRANGFKTFIPSAWGTCPACPSGQSQSTKTRVSRWFAGSRLDNPWSGHDAKAWTIKHHERRVVEMLTGQATRLSFNGNSSRTHADGSESSPTQRSGAASSCYWPDRLSAYVSLVVLGILLCVLVCPAYAAEPGVKNVLVLHNWANLPPSWALMESTVRARVSGQINFYTTSVENPRFDEEVYQESLAETLRRGYGGVKLDLVIAATYPVLQFAVQYRDKMFPGVPIVFTDVSRPEGQIMWQGVTGVISPLGMRETIDLALHLHPHTNAVAIITGVTKWDKYWLAVAHTELLHHQDKVREIDLIGPAGSQVIEQVAELPPATVVLFQLRPDDLTQPAVEPFDILAEVAERFPTYSAWQGLALNRGGVGGAYRNVRKDAVLNGQIVARVLSGEKPDNIPFTRDSDLQVHVDWRALQRWHISESALLPGTVVEYRQLTFWQRDRKYIVIAIVLIVAQALLIAGLLLQRARKRKAEAVLLESEERFRVMADTTASLLWMCDARGRITYLNGRRIAFTGTDSNADYGDDWITYVHPGDVERTLGTLYEALKRKRPFSQEYRLRRSDGVYRWMFDVASPRVNADGSFGGFIGSANDTTDQKLAQQALERVSGQLIQTQEEERSRIARELHDDICQRLALLSMELEQANRGSNGSSAQRNPKIDEIKQHCGEIAGDVQALSHKLHSSKLEYLGIVAAIKSFCREFCQQHEVSVKFSDENVPGFLPNDISLSLFRVTQEALQNALKYSGVREYSVSLRVAAGEIQLEISDGGAGFDVEQANRQKGLGLVSMQERVHLVHGIFRIESKVDSGTRIFIRVPFVAEMLVPENTVEAF